MMYKIRWIELKNNQLNSICYWMINNNYLTALIFDAESEMNTMKCTRHIGQFYRKVHHQNYDVVIMD